MPKEDIAWAIDTLKHNAKAYKLLENYYDGEHPLTFATEKFRNAFGPLFREFSDNLCPAIVDAVSDRLNLIGWNGDQARAVTEFWKLHRLPRVSNQIHRTAPKLGDAYLIVWPNDDGRACFWPQVTEQIAVDYDDPADPTIVSRAAKVWTEDDGFGRLNLYYSDHIEKYRTTGPIESSGGYPDKLFRWASIGDVTNDYDRVPIFHFGNAAEIGELGHSELVNVLPLQDGLNKAMCDMFVAMEFVAMPQRYATGLQVEVDEDTGKVKNPPFTPGVERVWTAAGDVKFGEFNQADLTKFIAVQDAIRLEMGRVSGTPPHFLWLGDTTPTGESSKISEGRLAKKIEDRSTTFTDPWVDVVMFGFAIEGKPLDPMKFEPVWETPTPHNPLLDAETQLVKQQVGLSKRQSLREMGYSDEMIDQMQAEAQEEKQKVLDQAMQAQPGLLGPDGKPISPPGNAPGADLSGRPTAFNRNGAPGEASRPAPQKQQRGASSNATPRTVPGRGQRVR